MRVWYDSLRQHGPRPSLEEWRRRSVPWWGSVVEARSGAQKVRGVARGVDEQGALVLDLPDGTRTAVLAGEVHRVRLGKEAQ
jgi:biotin-(acetyl-CoA carboxylase) ligase